MSFLSSSSLLVEQCHEFGLWTEPNNNGSRSARHGSLVRRHRTEHHIETVGQSSGTERRGEGRIDLLRLFFSGGKQKLSVQTVLNGSFGRQSDKQQSTSLLTGITRNGNSFNLLNQSSTHDSSLPFLNNSVGSPGTSARLHHSHHHHHGAAAATARSLRREKTREGSLKSSSKETSDSSNHHLFQQQHHPHHHHHTAGNSSIVSSSHPYSRSKSFFPNTSAESINKPPTFPMKPSGSPFSSLLDSRLDPRLVSLQRR